MSTVDLTRMIYCLYERGWVRMGRSRTRCPKCGAVIGVAGHVVEMREEVQR